MIIPAIMAGSADKPAPAVLAWEEQKPAGDANKNWDCCDVSGNKMVAGIDGGRLYYFDGTEWSEQQPAGDVNQRWLFAKVEGNTIFAGAYGKRLWFYNGTSWAEVRPIDDNDYNWLFGDLDGGKMLAIQIATGDNPNANFYYFNGTAWDKWATLGDFTANRFNSVSLDGSVPRIIVGIDGGRLNFITAKDTLSEQQPAGNANKDWNAVAAKQGKALAATKAGTPASPTGRLYYYNGSTWSELQPEGDVERLYYSVSMQFGKFFVSASTSKIYFYNTTSWESEQPSGSAVLYDYVAISGNRRIVAKNNGRLYAFK